MGSTAIGVAHDPEVVRETLARAFASLRQELEGHGGTVEKFIGDAVMAVFGVPAVHDDDAERAVRAAFACREAVTTLNATQRFPLELRIGVNTGEAVAGTAAAEQFLVTGTQVTLGSRLQSAAAPGEILVGELTHRLTHGAVSYGAARQIDAKGVGLVPAWPATSLTTDLPEQHRGIRGLRATIIGRDAELQLLQDTLDRVTTSGAAALVTVYGPAGVGKSRLVSEFAGRVRDTPVLFGRCLPYGEGITLFPIQQILRADLGIELTDPLADAVRKLRARVSSLFDDKVEGDRVAARLTAVVGLAHMDEALPGIGSSELAGELHWGVRRYVERRTTGAAFVLVFEDLHWAEGGLLDLIEDLAEWTRAPVLIVSLARPEFRERRPSWAQHVANASVVTLTPLGTEDTRRLIAELLALESLPEGLRSAVTTRAEGNPLYVEEFLRMLIDTGQIAEQGGRWIVTATLTELAVPPTLQGIITARLDQVAPEVKRLLQRASLVGRLFSVAALAAIGGESMPAQLFREAVRRDLLIEADERAPGEGRVYRFKHVLIRDVVYGTITKADRARMHDNYGRWLERTFGDRKDEFADLVAFHAEQAFLLAAELARAGAQALGERALALLMAAGRRAALRTDLAAAGLYERAGHVSELFSAGERSRAEARVLAAVWGYRKLEDEQGPTAAARAFGPALEHALALCEATPSVEGFPDLLIVLGDIAHVTGEPELARARWDRILEVSQGGAPEVVAAALRAHAGAAYRLGDFAEWEARSAKALEYIRAHGIEGVLVPRFADQVEFAMGRGDFGAASKILLEWEAALPAAGSRQVEVRAIEYRAQVCGAIGDHHRARELLDRSLTLAQDLGSPGLVGAQRRRLGEAWFALGEWGHARAEFEAAALLFETRGQRGQLPEVATRAARACVRLGDREAARSHVTKAASALLPTDIESRYMLLIAQAELAEADGDAIAADAGFREALSVIGPTLFGDNTARTRIAYAEFLIRAGRFAEAREQLSAARDFFSDPLASRRRDDIDLLQRRCEVGV